MKMMTRASRVGSILGISLMMVAVGLPGCMAQGSNTRLKKYDLSADDSTGLRRLSRPVTHPEWI